MWKERLRKVKVIITIVLILGVAIYLVMVYDAAKSIRIVDKRIKSVYPSKIDEYDVKFSLTLKNPKNFDIEIDYISYNIYVENEFVGKGIKPHFYIESGTKKYDFDATFSVKGLSESAKNLLIKGGANIKIKGVVMIPAKFLGLFTWKHIKIPYEINEQI
ncbi:MAG: LEA type 2 family protein [Thermoplasmata archaeon]|nr:LEA type 2 family protein [Thermoplasmata archaeon]